MCEEITKERGSGRMSGTEDLTGGQSSHFPEGSGNSLEQPGWKIRSRGKAFCLCSPVREEGLRGQLPFLVSQQG